MKEPGCLKVAAENSIEIYLISKQRKKKGGGKRILQMTERILLRQKKNVATY
jgi:hypothetical protein